MLYTIRYPRNMVFNYLLSWYTGIEIERIISNFIEPPPNTPYQQLSILKPIFHQKSRLRWLPNAREQETNMAYANPTLAYPTQTIFHWLSMGLALGLPGFLLGSPGFLDTNMLVSSCVGGLEQRVWVDYKLNRKGSVTKKRCVRSPVSNVCVKYV